MVEQGRVAGLHAYAGHGLRTDNAGAIAAIPGMEELNIGHFIIARAVIVGMDAAVGKCWRRWRGARSLRARNRGHALK